MLREEGTRLFRGVAFASCLFGEALVEVGADGVLVTEEPVFHDILSFDEIEGVGEEVGRAAEGSAVKLALDSLFGGGVWRDDHGGIIGLGLGGGKLLGVSVEFRAVAGLVPVW
jgi:hypothetical protein